MSIGDKVVFVDNSNWDSPPTSPPLVLGNVYVIRGFAVCRTGKLVLYLLGVYCEYLANGVERGPYAWRFRKLDEMQNQTKAFRDISNLFCGLKGEKDE